MMKIKDYKKKPLIQTNPNQITRSNPKHQIKAYDTRNHRDKNINEYCTSEFILSSVICLLVNH